MGYLLLRILGTNVLKLYFVCSIFSNIDCNKCGQTPRLVTGAQIQPNSDITTKFMLTVQSHVFPGQPSQAIPLNIARYRKAVNSALWIQVTLVVCYLPFGIAVALTPQRGIPLSSYLARNFAGTIVYLNSSLNPFLYCWKMRQVRQAVKETLRQLFCWSSWSSMYSTILHNSPWDSAAIFIFFIFFSVEIGFDWVNPITINNN